MPHIGFHIVKLFVVEMEANTFSPWDVLTVERKHQLSV
jgi:hypothetical protein